MRRQIVGLIMALCCAAACTSEALAQGEPAFRTFRAYVGDLSGDGVSDIAVADPLNEQRVTVLSGANGSTLFQVVCPQGELVFALAATSICDMDGDGLGDLAVASLEPTSAETANGVIHVYSGRSGLEIGAFKNWSDPASPPQFKLMGDLNNDGMIDEIDLLLAIRAAMGVDASDPRSLDMNADGLVDMTDIVLLLEKFGLVALSDCAAGFRAAVDQAEELTNNPDWRGIDIPEEYQPAPTGVLGCAWCAIHCASDMLKAGWCADQVAAMKRRCWALPDAFAIAQCLQNVNGTVTACLANVAGAAGSCGKCVWKCMPKPTGLAVQ